MKQRCIVVVTVFGSMVEQYNDTTLTHTQFSFFFFIQDTEACIVTGKCQHSYHRHCILDWVKVDHDDCPNCRATMWDADVLDRMNHD